MIHQERAKLPSEHNLFEMFTLQFSERQWIKKYMDRLMQQESKLRACADKFHMFETFWCIAVAVSNSDVFVNHKVELAKSVMTKYTNI
jgi:hypothetical protein